MGVYQMNEYMKPDYEVMVFEANEYVSACYEINVSDNTTSGSAGWCQAPLGWYYDMNNTLSKDDDILWEHKGNNCNNNNYGSATYQIVAKDLVKVDQLWGNSYHAENPGTGSYNKPSNLGTSNLYISFFHNEERHAMRSDNFAGIVERNTGSWSNHS